MNSEKHISEFGINERSDEIYARPDDTFENLYNLSFTQFDLADIEEDVKNINILPGIQVMIV